MIFGKQWGQTALITSNKALELHHLHIQAGGRCSKHRHLTKYNGFFVIRGKVCIRVWKADQGLVDETILGPGQFTAVEPPEWHQFEALEDTEALELYWAQFDPTDIEREVPQ